MFSQLAGKATFVNNVSGTACLQAVYLACLLLLLLRSYMNWYFYHSYHYSTIILLQLPRLTQATSDDEEPTAGYLLDEITSILNRCHFEMRKASVFSHFWVVFLTLDQLVHCEVWHF